MNSVSRRAALPALAALAALMFGLLLVVLAAPRAAAHNTLVSSDPVDGSTVSTAPALITLVFNEPAQELGSEIVVTDPNGVTVSTGAIQLADATVSQALTGDLPAGAYTVTWRVTSADGHPIDGTLTFTAEAATTLGVDPGPSATPSDASSAAPEVTTQAEPTESATQTPTPISAPVMAEDEEAGLAAGAIVAIVVGVLALAAVITFVIYERRKAKKVAQDQ